VASIVLLLFLVAVECLRACVRRSETVFRPGVLGGTAVLAAAGFEFLQKTMYRRYVRTVYGNDWTQFVTRFRLDSGHLLDNLGVHLHDIGRLTWWPFYVLSILAFLTLVGGFTLCWINKTDRLSTTLRSALADDTAVLIVGASGIAAINFVLNSSSNSAQDYGWRIPRGTATGSTSSQSTRTSLDSKARTTCSMAGVRCSVLRAGPTHHEMIDAPRACRLACLRHTPDLSTRRNTGRAPDRSTTTCR
jgi:hypothetical protein